MEGRGAMGWGWESHKPFLDRPSVTETQPMYLRLSKWSMTRFCLAKSYLPGWLSVLMTVVRAPLETSLLV